LMTDGFETTLQASRDMLNVDKTPRMTARVLDAGADGSVTCERGLQDQDQDHATSAHSQRSLQLLPPHATVRREHGAFEDANTLSGTGTGTVTPVQRKMNVLVVDDSTLNRKMLCKLLKASGYICEEAEDGAVAMAKVTERIKEAQQHAGPHPNRLLKALQDARLIGSHIVQSMSHSSGGSPSGGTPSQSASASPRHRMTPSASASCSQASGDLAGHSAGTSTSTSAKTRHNVTFPPAPAMVAAATTTTAAGTTGFMATAIVPTLEGNTDFTVGTGVLPGVSNRAILSGKTIDTSYSQVPGSEAPSPVPGGTPTIATPTASRSPSRRGSISIPAEFEYCVIIMDYVMPNVDGPTATKRIRDMGYKGLIFGVTGNALQSDIDYFISQGANTVLTKPLDMRMFNRALEGMSVCTT
jgi:CheY-like chemotaxis protein